MENKIPTSLRIIRVLAILAIVLGFLTFISFSTILGLSTMINMTIIIVGYVIGLAFEILVILSINRRKKALYNTVCAVTALLVLISIAEIIMLQNSSQAIRIVVELALLYFFWKNKSYFSA
jgi:hypothetical protein